MEKAEKDKKQEERKDEWKGEVDKSRLQRKGVDRE